MDIKVGLIACSGEEIPEGTLTRTAVRLVLEKLRPRSTVTICLPLFLAGESGERDFAKRFPTIAVDGCGKLCAKTGTEKLSAKIDDVVNVEDLLREWGVKAPPSRRALDEEGWKLAWRIAEEIASRVDVLLLKNAAGPPEESAAAALEEVTAADEPVCSCMSGAMKKTAVNVAGATVELTALEPILRFVGGLPDLSPEQRRDELLRQVKLYNGAVSEVCEGDLAAALYELLIAGKGA